MQKKRVTLQQLAQASGVSVSAVSMALRNHPRISPQKRKEINRMATEMGYVYNRHAANLRKSVSNTIAVCVNDLKNPVFMGFLASIEKVCRQHHKLLLLCNAHESTTTQTEFIQKMLEQGAAGLLLSPVIGSKSEELIKYSQQGLPVVMFSRRLKTDYFDTVLNDDAKGVEMAVKALYESGHRHIGWIGGGQQTSTAEQRFESYQETLQELGMIVDDMMVDKTIETTRAAGQDAMKRLLGNCPYMTAVVCFSDLLALGATMACLKKGLNVGKEIAIIGHDDIEEASYCNPSLSTINVPTAEIGEKAAIFLLDRLKHTNRTAQHMTITPQLKLRQTAI